MLRLEAVCFATGRPDAAAKFWAGLLGRRAVPERAATRLPGTKTQVGLRFVAADIPVTGLNRLHLHLTSTSPGDQARIVAQALALGGRHLDVGQLPEEGHLVLADPGGDELCVIGPDSTFLAGCGPLGEVACDGTREVGLFWSAALGWPLVWDQDGETAIQPPGGGTKVAWGEPPVAPKHGHNRQWFELSSTDVGTDLPRLVSLGATVVDEVRHEMADPDGNEFQVLAR